MVAIAENAKIANGVNGMRKVKRLRSVLRARRSSLSVEIEREAKRIMAQRSEDAYKAAALMVCSRKLDEIRSILQVAGLSQVSATNAHVAGTAVDVARNVQVAAGPACVQCGRPAIRKTKPNQWNRTGSWYCQIHVGLANQSEFEDAMDNRLLGAQAGAVPRKPAVVQTQAPAVMRSDTPAPEATIQPTATTPQDAPGAGSLDAAMASLGVN